MDRRQNEIGECKFQKAQIETRAIERNNDGIFFEMLRELLKEASRTPSDIDLSARSILRVGEMSTEMW